MAGIYGPLGDLLSNMWRGVTETPGRVWGAAMDGVQHTSDFVRNFPQNHPRTMAGAAYTATNAATLGAYYMYSEGFEFSNEALLLAMVTGLTYAMRNGPEAVRQFSAAQLNLNLTEAQELNTLLALPENHEYTEPQLRSLRTLVPRLSPQFPALGPFQRALEDNVIQNNSPLPADVLAVRPSDALPIESTTSMLQNAAAAAIEQRVHSAPQPLVLLNQQLAATEENPASTVRYLDTLLANLPPMLNAERALIERARADVQGVAGLPRINMAALANFQALLLRIQELITARQGAMRSQFTEQLQALGGVGTGIANQMGRAIATQFQGAHPNLIEIGALLQTIRTGNARRSDFTNLRALLVGLQGDAALHIVGRRIEDASQLGHLALATGDARGFSFPTLTGPNLAIGQTLQAALPADTTPRVRELLVNLMSDAHDTTLAEMRELRDALPNIPEATPVREHLERNDPAANIRAQVDDLLADIQNLSRETEGSVRRAIEEALQSAIGKVTELTANAPPELTSAVREIHMFVGLANQGDQAAKERVIRAVQALEQAPEFDAEILREMQTLRDRIAAPGIPNRADINARYQSIVTKLQARIGPIAQMTMSLTMSLLDLPGQVDETARRTFMAAPPRELDSALDGLKRARAALEARAPNYASVEDGIRMSRLPLQKIVDEPYTFFTTEFRRGNFNAADLDTFFRSHGAEALANQMQTAFDTPSTHNLKELHRQLNDIRHRPRNYFGDWTVDLQTPKEQIDRLIKFIPVEMGHAMLADLHQFFGDKLRANPGDLHNADVSAVDQLSLESNKAELNQRLQDSIEALEALRSIHPSGTIDAAGQSMLELQDRMSRRAVQAAQDLRDVATGGGSPASALPPLAQVNKLLLEMRNGAISNEAILGKMQALNEQFGTFTIDGRANVLSEHVCHALWTARGSVEREDAKQHLTTDKTATQVAYRTAIEGYVAQLPQSVKDSLAGNVYKEVDRLHPARIDRTDAQWGERHLTDDLMILLNALEKTPNALKKKSAASNGFLSSITSHIGEIIGFASGNGGSLAGGLGSICSQATEFVINKAITYVNSLEIPQGQKDGYVSILNEMLNGWNRGEGSEGRGIRNAESVSDYRNALGYFADRMAEMPPIVIGGTTLPIFDPFVELEEPHDALIAGLNAMDQLGPHIEGSTEFSEVQLAKEEFDETLRFFAIYNILTATQRNVDPEAFKRIMGEVLAVGGDIEDQEKRFAIRKEKFLTEYFKRPLEEAGDNSVKQFFHDIFLWFRKIPARFLFWVCSFYTKQFTDNGIAKLHEQLLKINEQSSRNPADQIDIDHVSNATGGLNHITEAMGSWAFDRRGGEQSKHVDALLGSEFGYNRKDLYKQAGKLAVQEFIDEFNLMRTPIKAAIDAIKTFIYHNHFHNDGAGYIGNGMAKILKFIILQPVRLLMSLPYLASALVDKTLHHIVVASAKHIVFDRNELVRKVVDSTRDNITRNRYTYLLTQQSIRDKLYEIRHQLQGTSGDNERIPMAHPTREAMKTMIASLREMVIQSEHRTQGNLRNAIEGQQTSIERARIFAEEMASDAVIDQITDVVAAALNSAVEESHINLRLSEILRAGSNALTGLGEVSHASNEDLARVDEEIKALRKEIIKIIIDRASTEMSPGVQVLRDQGTMLIQSPRKELLGHDDHQGELVKWRELLNQYRAIPEANRRGRVEKAQELHGAMNAFLRNWTSKMTSVRTENSYNDQLKAQFYRKFKDLNKLFVHFEGENAEAELRHHLEHIHDAMNIGQPMRDRNDIVSSLCNLLRSEERGALLHRASHIAESILGATNHTLDRIGLISAEMGTQERAEALGEIEAHLGAISHQIFELENLPRLEDLRVYEERQNNSLISESGYRHMLLTQLKKAKDLLAEKMVSIKELSQDITLIQTLRGSNKITQLVEAAQREASPSNGATGWLQRTFSSSASKKVVEEIKRDFIDKLHSEERKQVLLAKLNEMTNATTDREVSALHFEFCRELDASKRDLIQNISTARDQLTTSQRAMITMLEERTRRWNAGIDVEGGRIEGRGDLRALADRHAQRLEQLMNQIEGALPGEDAELELAEIFQSNNQDRTRNSGGLPRFVKHLIENRVIQLADHTMEIVSQPYVMQHLLDEMVVVPFVREKGRLPHKATLQPIPRRENNRQTN